MPKEGATVEFISSVFVLLSLAVGSLVIGTVVFVGIGYVLYFCLKPLIWLVMDLTVPKRNLDEDAQVIVDRMKGYHS